MTKNDGPQVEFLKYEQALETLKLCPFCGGEGMPSSEDAPAVGTDDLYWIECDNCGAQGQPCESPFKAIERWNTRGQKAAVIVITTGNVLTVPQMETIAGWAEATWYQIATPSLDARILASLKSTIEDIDRDAKG